MLPQVQGSIKVPWQKCRASFKGVRVYRIHFSQIFIVLIHMLVITLTLYVRIDLGLEGFFLSLTLAGVAGIARLA
jgi:hypothetical protein